MTENRYDWDMNGIFDYGNNDEDYISEYEDLSNLLNDQNERINKLEKENKYLRCSIESNSQDDYIDYLKRQNEKLKNFIKNLADNCGMIVLINGYVYRINKMIDDD